MTAATARRSRRSSPAFRVRPRRRRAAARRAVRRVPGSPEGEIHRAGGPEDSARRPRNGGAFFVSRVRQEVRSRPEAGRGVLALLPSVGWPPRRVVPGPGGTASVARASPPTLRRCLRGSLRRPGSHGRCLPLGLRFRLGNARRSEGRAVAVRHKSARTSACQSFWHDLRKE